MVLEIVSLTKRYSGFTLGPLNLKINREVLVMIGPTGSGKTTLLNIIAGMIRPDGGSVILDGSDITELPLESRRIGYVFQTPNLFPHLNVYDNIIFGVSRRDRQRKSHYVRKILDEMGLSHISNRDIQGLSGGEMQKVSIARMLVVEPRIILLDEPLVHLDPFIRRKLRLELRQILKMQGIPAIYVTHYEDDVYALADSVAVLRNGSIENAGRLEEILSSNSSPFISEIVEGSNYIEGVVVESKNGIAVIKVGMHLLKTLGEYGVNSRLGILIRPEDILLSREAIKTSARNVIKARVAGIREMANLADVQLQTDSLHLRCRITAEARTELSLMRDDQVYAIFKATSPQVVREES
ncbi:MAG: ABC transporter ATP-binding protein [Nitrososphaera sp.]